jgi:hypothetical protein
MNNDGPVNDIRTLNEWISFWREHYKVELNPHTTRVRRNCAGVGRRIPPGTYLLTLTEFEQVLNTPLPRCVNGAKAWR